jgi:hypothetical protein
MGMEREGPLEERIIGAESVQREREQLIRTVEFALGPRQSGPQPEEPGTHIETPAAAPDSRPSVEAWAYSLAGRDQHTGGEQIPAALWNSAPRRCSVRPGPGLDHPEAPSIGCERSRSLLRRVQS